MEPLIDSVAMQMPLPRQLLLGNGVWKRGPIGPWMVFDCFLMRTGLDVRTGLAPCCRLANVKIQSTLLILREIIFVIALGKK